MTAIIETNLDQAAGITAAQLEGLNTIDDVVEACVTAASPDHGIQYIGFLRQNQQIQGLGMAKILFKLSRVWDQFPEAIEERFEDRLMADVGLSKQTIRKYIGAWDALFAADHVPEKLKAQLMGKPIGALLLLPALARDDIAKPEDWERIVMAPDRAAVRAIVRELRGEKTSSKTAMTLMIDGEGQITATRADSDIIPIGWLQLKSASAVGQDAVDRIIDSADILTK